MRQLDETEDETVGYGTDNLKVARSHTRATGHTSSSHIHEIIREEKRIHMNTITKKILIDRIADTTGMKRVAVKQVVQEFLDQVIVELGDGNRLEFRDFGVFEVKERAPRIAQNPKTLERVPVPAKRTVKFKVGRRMREAMEGEIVATTTLTKAADGMKINPAATNHQAKPMVAASATQSESKLRVEMGPGVAGTIRSDSTPVREQTAATTH